MKFILVMLLAASLQTTGIQQESTIVKKLTPTEYKEQAKKKNAILLDVRTPEEFAGGHLKNAVNVDYRSGKFATEMKNWDKNKTYYLYCASGNRSGKAAKLMEEAGFKHIYNIGGFPELQKAGLPVKGEQQKKSEK